jgi:hypothetical protein
LVGISEADKEQLESLLGIPKDAGDSDANNNLHHGEPTLITLAFILSNAVLQGLGMWVLQKRSRSSVRFEIEKRAPDGRTERAIIRMKLSESSTPDVVAKKILEGLESNGMVDPVDRDGLDT